MVTQVTKAIILCAVKYYLKNKTKILLVKKQNKKVTCDVVVFRMRSCCNLL